MACKDPDQYKPIGGECQYDCSKYGSNSKSCGSNCYDSSTQQCLPGNSVCDNIRTTYDRLCCDPDTTYQVVKSTIFPDGPPWNNNDDISKMNTDIKSAIKDNTKYTIRHIVSVSDINTSVGITVK